MSDDPKCGVCGKPRSMHTEYQFGGYGIKGECQRFLTFDHEPPDGVDPAFLRAGRQMDEFYKGRNARTARTATEANAAMSISAAAASRIAEGEVKDPLGEAIGEILSELPPGVLLGALGQATARVEGDSKPSNPKDMIGSDKLPLSLWPATATAMGCLGILNGMLKYGMVNWRVTGVRNSIYLDAAMRHFKAYQEGEWLDPVDGQPHLSGLLACIAIIIDAHYAGKLVDDRPYVGPGNGYARAVLDLTPIVGKLRAYHAGKNPVHYTISYKPTSNYDSNKE